MKISQQEIDAAKDACTYLTSDAARDVILAVLTVRRARKAAKRERQRKEKDKHVQESVNTCGSKA